ncbi:MAG: hypothetical protein KA214_02615 [Neisseriaceae bacterium]|nr:hypothetical protein [Neisseriaceae bacterium]
MNKTVKIHGIAATLALGLVMLFWTSTVIAEVFLDVAAIVWVKEAIMRYGLVFMVVAVMVTGRSGMVLARQRNQPTRSIKKQRMPWIVLNGLLCLLPAAIYLSFKASAGEFDAWFLIVQFLELIMGLVQMTLLGRNFMAGVRLVIG